MTDRERCEMALTMGDATAFIAVADAWADEGRSEAEELAQLANEIASTDDWALALVAGAVFLQILDMGSRQT
jgi:hypothetical protein